MLCECSEVFTKLSKLDNLTEKQDDDDGELDEGGLLYNHYR